MSHKEKKGISYEEIKLKSNHVKDKVLQLIADGTARRVIIKKDGRILLELPLAVGLGGAAAAILINAPLTALAAIAALATNVNMVIIREPHSSEENSP